MMMLMWEFDLRGLPTHHIQEGEGIKSGGTDVGI